MKKIILINIFVILLIFIIANIVLKLSYRNFLSWPYSAACKMPPESIKKNYDLEDPPKDLWVPFDKEHYDMFVTGIRRYFGGKYSDKKPIIVLGCSYAHGQGIVNDKECFPYRLAEITKRPVISFAKCASNILDNFSTIYKEIKKDKKLEEQIKNSDYVIYVYMHDHIVRFVDIARYDFDKFDEDLFEYTTKEKILSKIFLFRYIIDRRKMQEILKEYPESDNCKKLLKKVIEISAKRVKELAPNAEFIVVLYEEKLSTQYSPDYTKFHMDTMYSNIWDELEKEGITIVHSKDLLGFKFDKNYKLKKDYADWHPNGKAWEVFTPAFAKKYIKP